MERAPPAAPPMAAAISLAGRGRDRDRPAFLRVHDPRLLGAPVDSLVVVPHDHRRRDLLVLGRGHLENLLHPRERRADAYAPPLNVLSPR